MNIIQPLSTDAHSNGHDHSSIFVPHNDRKTAKASRKGKTAIITSDSYKENLMAEKIKNIKKEKIDNKSKESKNKARKHKSSSSIGINATSKKRKPLQDLNQDQPNILELMPASSEFLINNNRDSLQCENLLRETIPDSSILNSQIAFVNGEQVEICYIDESTANSLNLRS